MEWLNNVRPNYHAGQTVWVVYVAEPGSPRWEKSVVRAVPVGYINDGTGERLLWKGWYDLSTPTRPEGFPPTWAFMRYVFDSELDAAKAAKWWSCSKFTGDEMFDAAAQLMIPDDNMMLVYDKLIRCIKMKGMMEVDRLHLADLIAACNGRPKSPGKHYYDSSSGEMKWSYSLTHSALGMVLAALDMQWPIKENA